MGKITKDDLKITTYKDKKDYAFISYASKDGDIVFDNYVIPLYELGLNIFCDLDFKQHAQKNWVDQMKRNLEKSKICLIFTSKDYVCSYACYLEVFTALILNVPILKIQINQPINSNDTKERTIKQPTIDKFDFIKDQLEHSPKGDPIYVHHNNFMNAYEHIKEKKISPSDLSPYFIKCLDIIAGTIVTDSDGYEAIKNSIMDAAKENSNVFSALSDMESNNLPKESSEITENSTLVNDDTEDVFSMDNENSAEMDSDVFSDESYSSNSFKPADPNSFAVAWEGGEIADDDDWDDIPDQNADDSPVETYTICGTEFSGNYKKILTDALTHIVNEHFEKFDMLAEKIPCLSDKSQSELSHMFPDDVSLTETEEFDYDGDIYTIGINIDRKTAFAHIRKAIMLTGENPHDYVIDGLYNEKQMIRAEKQYAEANSPFAAFSSFSNPFKNNDTWGDSDDDWGESDNTWGNNDNGWGKPDNTWGNNDNGWDKSDNTWGNNDNGWDKSDNTWGNNDNGWSKSDNTWGNNDNGWGKSDNTWSNSDDDWGDWDDWDNDDTSSSSSAFAEEKHLNDTELSDVDSIEDTSTENDSVKSSSENCYIFCGNTVSGNQSQMMTAVIKYIVETHFDMFDTLCKELTCLAKGSRKSQTLNFFNVGGEFTYQGVTYSIGTAYGLNAKLAQIRKAIILTGENPHDYQIDGLFNEKQLNEAEQSFENAQKAKAANKPDVGSITNSSTARDTVKSSSDNGFSFCGNTVSGNQSQMMTAVIKYIVEKHFDMFDTLCKELTCLAKGSRKSQKLNFFNVGGEYTYQGVTYSIGTSYGRDAKLAQIRKAIITTGENPNDYQIDGLFNEKQLKEAEESYAKKKA